MLHTHGQSKCCSANGSGKARREKKNRQAGHRARTKERDREESERERSEEGTAVNQLAQPASHTATPSIE